MKLRKRLDAREILSMSKQNSNQALVSVVMPTYNHCDFIGMSIESVLNQTYENMELIIIDNHSVDDTREVVSAYSSRDKRIKYVLYDNNGFIANSRNRGIGMSGGEYVAFIDSDDLWYADKLQKQIALFNAHDVGLVYCGAQKIDENSDLIIGTNKLKRCYHGYVLSELLSFKLSFACSSVVVRKSILEIYNMGFALDRQGAEDWDLWIRLAEHTKICCAEGILVGYRVHGNATSKNYKMMYRSKITTLNDFRDRFRHICESENSYDRRSLLKAYRHSYIKCMDMYANHLLGENEYREVGAVVFDMLKLKTCSIRAWMMLLKLIVYPFYETFLKSHSCSRLQGGGA